MRLLCRFCSVRFQVLTYLPIIIQSAVLFVPILLSRHLIDNRMLTEDSQIQEYPQGQPQLTQTPSQPLQVYYTAKTLTTPYATAHNANLLTGVKSAAPAIQYEVV